MNVFSVRFDGLFVPESVDDVEGVADVAADQLDAVGTPMSRGRAPMSDQPLKQTNRLNVFFVENRLNFFEHMYQRRG